MTITGTASAKRRTVDQLMRWLLVLSVVITLTPLIWILIDVAKKGLSSIKPSFFTQGPSGPPFAVGGGIAHGMIGTLVMVGIGGLIAIPLGILGAIWLVEFGAEGKRVSVVRFFADVMTGIPSIIFGIFVYSLVVVAMGHFSALAGAIALSMIMWPIALRTSEEMLRLVPNELREAAYALGAPKWKTVVKVVLPSAGSGLVTGILLAIARATGETAPLLFTALNADFVRWSIGQPMAAMSTYTYLNAGLPYNAAVQRAWGSALTLIVLILILSLGSRAVVSRRERRAQ